MCQIGMGCGLLIGVNNSEIKKDVESTKYLSLITDKRLNCKMHVDKLKQELFACPCNFYLI